MIDKVRFGKRISVLRKKNNLSQAQLAQRFNVSPQAVSKWETGLTLPDIDILLELSAIKTIKYGLSVKILIGLL